MQLTSVHKSPLSLPSGPGRLIVVTEGTLVVESTAGSWPLERDQAVWLCAGSAATLVSPESAVAAVMPIEAPVDRRAGPVTVTPLLRALVARLVDDTMAGAPPAPGSAVHAVVADELGRQSGTLEVPPALLDSRLQRLAARLLAADGLRLTLAEAGREVGMSARNLSRLVRRETGSSFGRWRQMLHVSAAIPRLAAGEPVASVAYAIGYESPSAFIAMFRRMTSMTPAEYADWMRAGGRQSPA